MGEAGAGAGDEGGCLPKPWHGWQDQGDPYPHASRTPRTTGSGTETFPPASADSALGGRWTGLGGAAGACWLAPFSFLSPLTGWDSLAFEVLTGPPLLGMPLVGCPGPFWSLDTQPSPSCFRGPAWRGMLPQWP